MRTLRRVFHWLHFVAACLVVLGVFVQVYLATGQLFGTDSLDHHRDLGWMVHNVELAVFVAALVAWLPRTDLGWAFALAVVGTAQILLAEADRWVGAIHGVGALVVLIIASIIAHRDVRGLGLRRGAPAASGSAPPPPLP